MIRKQKSLSARRAWIEIGTLNCHNLSAWVALRKESVDRNVSTANDGATVTKSLSARRAWIEMFTAFFSVAMAARSLSARRAWIEIWLHR